MEEPTALVSKGLINILLGKELAAINLIRPEHGGGRRMDYVSPQAPHIIRSPFHAFRAPINMNGLGRAKRAHPGESCPEITPAVVASIQKFHEPNQITFYIPAPAKRAINR